MKFLLALIAAAAGQKCEANLSLCSALDCAAPCVDVALSFDKDKCSPLKDKDGKLIAHVKVTKCEGTTWIQNGYDATGTDCSKGDVAEASGTIAKDACKKMGAKISGKLTRIGAVKKDDGKTDDKTAKKTDDKKAGAAKLMVGSAIAATLLAM